MRQASPPLDRVRIGVFGGHLSDPCPQRLRQPRSYCKFRFPAPEEPEPFAVPALLEERKLFAKEEVLRGQTAARMPHEDSQREQIDDNWQDRSDAMSNRSEER